MKKLPSRKNLIRQLDHQFSLMIRNRDMKVRGKCPFHHLSTGQIECCFHMITRAKQCVRWDPRNAIGACHKHNLKYEYFQDFIDDAISWYKREYGEKQWEQLKRDSNVPANFSRTDLYEKLQELKEENGVGA